ncbi:hypothetical protein T440DRAFT_409018, partial [Plenodomus tracheiphilus IPT5]
VSVGRSTDVAQSAGSTTAKLSCVECPCDGFLGLCKCIPNGCCCPLLNHR